MKMEPASKKRSTWFLLLMFFFSVCWNLPSPSMEGRSREAKHIILMVGDGMNIEHEIATSRYLYEGL